MSRIVSSSLQPREVFKSLQTHQRLWVLPTLAATLLAAAYCLVRTPVYKASQALLVRDEAGGQLNRQGRFDNADAMKTAQETIVEIAKNQAVVAAALRAIGPPDKKSDNWPSQRDIDALQAAISVTAPKGAEFGRTEVIYLTIAAPSREQALARTLAVCNELDARLKELRDRQATSIIAELVKGVALAQADLDAATRELETLETEVGSDLGELRILSDSGAGDSNLRAALTQIKNELRQVQTRHESLREQQSLLKEAQQDPDKLVATPNQLLESQPSLKRLKDGLVDAQLRTAQLLGKMNDKHPEVISAQDAEAAVRENLFAELDVSLRGLDGELQVTDALIQSLEKQQRAIEDRLNRLAALRARYSNLVAEVRNCSATLQKAQADLADARARQAAAQSASLMTRLDSPVVSSNPVGPAANHIVMGGAFGGLLIGLGLVFLRTPLAQLGGRRWSDCVQMGRRATDALRGRRATDRKPEGPEAAYPRAMEQPAEAPPGESPAAILPFGKRASDATGNRAVQAEGDTASGAAGRPSDGTLPVSEPAAAISFSSDRRTGADRRRT